MVQRAILAALFHTVPCVFRIRANWRRIPLNAVGYGAAERGARRGFLHSPWRCTAIGQGETIARIDLRVNRTRVLSFALSN